MRGLVWITGASQGIGYALVLHYLAMGYLVCASARSSTKLTLLAGQNELSEGELQVLPLDITDADATQQAVEKVCALAQHHQLPVTAILNAGTHQPESAHGFTSTTLQKLIDLNLIGTGHCLQALIPSLLKGQGNQIAVVASLAGYRGLPRAAAYGASKAALINLTESLASELSPRGLDIRLINPGFVQTPLTDKNDFPMPQCIRADEAARYIAAGLARPQFETRFPAPFSSFMELLRWLPNRLYLHLASRLVQKQR